MSRGATDDDCCCPLLFPGSRMSFQSQLLDKLKLIVKFDIFGNYFFYIYYIFFPYYFFHLAASSGQNFDLPNPVLCFMTKCYICTSASALLCVQCLLANARMLAHQTNDAGQPKHQHVHIVIVGIQIQLSPHRAASMTAHSIPRISLIFVTPSLVSLASCGVVKLSRDVL